MQGRNAANLNNVCLQVIGSGSHSITDITKIYTLCKTLDPDFYTLSENRNPLGDAFPYLHGRSSSFAAQERGDRLDVQLVLLPRSPGGLGPGPKHLLRKL